MGVMEKAVLYREAKRYHLDSITYRRDVDGQTII